MAEEAAVNPYYNNFFSTYRLGPEDVISVEVFNQPRYSRTNIIVPPSGRISLSLIQGGVFVNGKTVDEVAEVIKKRYDEYIIDPQVTVSLDKASSYRYSVIGDVGQPGIRLMNHRMTVTEAIAEAGGVLSTGNKSGDRRLTTPADRHAGTDSGQLVEDLQRQSAGQQSISCPAIRSSCLETNSRNCRPS